MTAVVAAPIATCAATSSGRTLAMPARRAKGSGMHGEHAVSEARLKRGESRGQHVDFSPSPSLVIPTIYTCAFTPKVQDDNGITRLTIRLHIKRLHGRRALLSPDGHDLLTTRTAEGRPIPREHIVHAIGLAHACRDELLRTRDRIADVARRWGLTQGRVHRLLTLAQLTPALLGPALRDNLPTSSSLDDRTVGGTNPDWQRQATHRLHPPTTDARRHKRASLAKARPLGTMRRKAFLVVGPLVAIP